eukprot:365535-Chlamydomonas_euryale.AAC.15
MGVSTTSPFFLCCVGLGSGQGQQCSLYTVHWYMEMRHSQRPCCPASAQVQLCRAGAYAVSMVMVCAARTNASTNAIPSMTRQGGTTMVGRRANLKGRALWCRRLQMLTMVPPQ